VNPEQKVAYEWAKSQNYQSVAARYAKTLADLIDSLTAQLSESQRRERDARNELCDKCGRYHEAHKGACDGCRWKETEQ